MATPYKSQRSPDLGKFEGVEKTLPLKESLAMFRKICLAHYFEIRAQKAHMDGDVTCLIYLSLGQESIPAGVSAAYQGSKPWVLGQHRAHSTYLSFGGRHNLLVDELLGLDTGCCKGMAGSPPIHDIENRIIGHNGLIGDHVPVSTGVGLANPDDYVVCFFGDGAAEEDYVLSALGYAASQKMKILFVCEDNDLSVLTPTETRRSWELVNVARGFGLEAIDIADDPWLVAHWAKELQGRPALLNVRTCRALWHAGTGTDGETEWDRFQITKNTLANLGLNNEASAIEAECQKYVEDLWSERLQTRSVS